MNSRPYSTPPPGRTSWWRKLAAFGAALALFGSAANAQYCSSNFSSATYEYVSNVTFAGINNSTGGNAGAPVDYTAQVASVTQGGSYPLSVTIQPDQFEYVWAFIDWNQNFVLNDAGEVYVLATSTSSAGPHTLSAAVPGGATPGNTRMRVICAYNSATPNPCVSVFYGEAEDYTVNVTAAACGAPSVVSTSGVTSSAATVNWTCTGCTGNYIVEYGLNGFTPGTGASAGVGGTIYSGGPVASGPVSLSGLTSLSNYAVYVRQNCSGTYSGNTGATFTTLCGGSSCDYTMVLTDNYGDGWNGGTFRVLQNGVSLGTFGTPNLSTGCGAATVPLNVCAGATLQFQWLTNDSYSECGLRIFDPFGLELYNFRGASQYPANCPGVTFTGLNAQPTTVNSIFFTTVANCTPPACNTPSSVSASSVTANSASVDWVCAGCTGTYIVEYGLNGFTPGTDGNPGVGGTILTGSPFAAGPQTISGLSSSTTYKVFVRQQCPGGVTWSSNVSTVFNTLLDCATAPTLLCTTSESYTIPAGTGQFFFGSTFCSPAGNGTGPFCTPGQEKIWQFTAPNAGNYVLNVTTTSNNGYADYFFKAAPGTCDATGWTYINDVFSPEQATFTITTPGTYYLLADLEGTTSVSQTFQVVCPLPCATPQFPFASAVTGSGAQINWTCTGCTGSQFVVEYGPTGFTLGTGTQITSATSPAAISGLAFSTPYQAYVYQDCNNVGDGLSNPSSVVSFTTLPPPPPNDLCADAITVTCGSIINSTNVGATGDGLPSQSGTFPVNIETGVWYKYIGDDQQVTLDLCASTLDTRVHVFRTTTDCSALTPFGGNDDNCGLNGWRSFYTFGAVTGFTYYIAVDGYGSSTNSFNLTVSCAPLCTPTVANDLCIDRQTVIMGSNCTPTGGNLGCATSTGGANPSCIGGLNTFPDAYFEFVATGPDAYVNLSGGANLRFVVYAGTSCATTPEFYCSPVVTNGVPTLLTGLTQGNTYVLRVLQPIANASTFTLCVQKLDVSDDPCAPVALACNDQRYGRTVGRANNLPVGACAFNGAASTGGVNYFTYTALADEDVTFSTCGLSTFDSRISVFTGACTSLACDLMNDDGPGCPSGSSTVQIRAVTGQMYTIMVHGAGAAEGDYQMIVFCEPYCSGVEANDRCTNAVTVPTWIAGEPGAVETTETLVCSYLDGPTSCSGSSAVQGVWYTFTTEAIGSDYDVYLASNTENPLYTATTLSMALFSGACSNTGAADEVICVSAAGGSTQLPPLAASTTYRMLVYNSGGLAEGTFGLLVTHPAFNDGGISAIATPNGTVCDQRLLPVVTLTNFGEGPLTSARIVSRIDASQVQVYDWSGPAIPTGSSVQVTLPEITSPAGLHDYTAEVTLANGVTDEQPLNSALTSNYDATGQTVVVNVRTDANPNQTTWGVYDPFFFPVAVGGPYVGQPNQTITTSVCLATTFGNCFFFFVFDNAGDGILSGSWYLTDSQSRMVLQDNGVFTQQSPSLTPASPVYFAHEFCLPLGPSPIQASECNVFNNYLNNKVYTTAVAGATNYQFEFSDPNAGFYRRITLPRNWVKFGEMVSNPLVFGTTYYCRARADQANNGMADDYYGAGCEMALALTQPVCTELISTPGNTFSCGVTKRFNGSDKIWAQPVTYATQYRFSFTGMIDPDGPNPNLATDIVGTPNFNDPPVMATRNIIRTSYVCPLNWATYQLVNNQTYNVSVECFVGGAWSGYCGAVCQVTIQNPVGMVLENGGHGTDRAEEVLNGTEVSLWPNPVRDGRVNLMIGGLVDETQMITVDVYDSFGKRVMSQHFENAGEVFNHVLDLDDSMAAGNYMVDITVNNERYIQRLNVVR